ncbi:hypothetical protein SAMN04487936_10482 [Halobacillus dabanensis]|uniref:Gamma-type small acid-soluble spore protein n=1 Tax=Halobacillus dabanensis TaxID=240302 RepID=A0A1I3TZQ5_HALDA|nr:hypothetical protein [Halobacillus dabanensis]SFJ76180.1 hypothetical protein SAMN04487936_10482 [Halobacillus dabanensis]
MKTSHQPDKNLNKDIISSSGTNISEVKRQNERSGLSYNQVKEMLANANQNQTH